MDANTVFLEAATFDSGGLSASSVAVADVNADGNLDLVVVNSCGSAPACLSGDIGVLLGNGDGTFQTAVTYGSGGQRPDSVAVADVNGDGKPDLLVANVCDIASNCNSSSVGVLLGNGDGTFQTAVTYASGGASASSISVADVNGDGKPDVLVAHVYAGGGNYSNGSVGVLLGNGDGTFRTAVSYASGGAYAYSAAVEDVNGDGKPDLIATNRCVSSSSCANGTVGILLGNGDGSFRTAVAYSSGGTNASSTAIADVNQDGKPDLLVTNQCADAICKSGAGSVGVILGNGDGTFQTPIVYVSGGNVAVSVAVGDVNGDGKPDLLVANQCEGNNSDTFCKNGTVAILFGNGDGTFHAGATYTSGGYSADSLVVRDINGDGKPDLVVSNGVATLGNITDNGVVAVLLGNGDGTFYAAPNYGTAGLFANGLASGDVNGDGNTDLLVSKQCVSVTDCSSGGVHVLLGTGSGTFSQAATYNSGGYQAEFVAASDLNGDGTLDMIVVNNCASSSNCANGSLGVLLGNGDGTFRAAVSYGSGGSYAYSVAVADVNGDGKPDLVVANQSATPGDLVGIVGILLGNGDGTFRPPVSYASGGQFAFSVAIADVDGDGKPDVLVANEYVGNGILSSGNVGVLLGNGNGTFRTAVAYGSGGIYTGSVAVADVNGDGKLDLLTSSECATPGCVNGVVGVLLGNGDGTFQTVASISTPQVPGDQPLVVADFDGDGKLDAASGAGGFLLLGNGDGSFQLPVNLAVAGTGIALGDFNHDGKPDLAVGGVSVLLNIAPRKTATTTSLISSLTPSAYGQSVTLTATVASQGTGTPKGTVTFTDGAAGLGTAALAGGRATLSTSALIAGGHNISASYSGDSIFISSTSASLAQAVNPANTTTALATSANPAYLNQSITFTAAVTAQYGGVSTGSVTFKQGTTTLATVALANGNAAYSMTYTTTGTRYLTAIYSGDVNNRASTSTVLNQAVNSLPAVTATKIASSGSPSFINRPVTFTATITSTYAPIPDGENVTFYDGTTAIGTGPIKNGTATLSSSSLAARTHTIKVTYPGDVTFKASSATLTQVVSLYPSTISSPTSSLNPSIYGQSVTLRATVTSTAPLAPTGTVTFKNGTSSLGSAPLNTGGFATLTKTNLPAGSLSISATYNGDSETAKSTSAVLLQTVNRASSTTTVKSSLNPALLGQTVTFTATVASPTTIPTGSVTFMYGSNTLATVNLSGGKGSYSTSVLSAGSHSMTVVYGGTANIVNSTSSSLVQTVH